MSDISNSNSSSFNKRRLSQIDDTIENLSHEARTLNEFVSKMEIQCSLMTIKLKRQKVNALSAVAKSQVLLADMDVLIAESDLFTDVQTLKNKMMKLSHDEVESQKDVPQQTTAPTITTVSVQTDKSCFKKKKTRPNSSRKSPIDIYSDETLIIPSILESSASLVETSQMSQTGFSLGLLGKMPSNESDSEVSLSSSIKAEFNKPYIKSPITELVKKSPAKKQKSDHKVESKRKSKHASKRTQSSTAMPKTVTDHSVSTVSFLRKIPAESCSNHNMELSSRTVSTSKNKLGDKKSTACATYVPNSHNMPTTVTQPSMCTMSPVIYVNPTTQASIQYHTQ